MSYLGQKAPRTAWKPGQSGNPKGRPTLAKTFAPLMRELLDGKAVKTTITLPDGSRKTWNFTASTSLRKALAIRLLARAIAGDIAAIREVLNRVDGMPTQPIDLSGVGPVFSVLPPDKCGDDNGVNKPDGFHVNGGG